MVTPRTKVASAANLAQTLITLMLVSLVAVTLVAFSFSTTPLIAEAQTTSPLYYTFNDAGTLFEAASASQTSSPYFWLKDGGQLVINNGVGSTLKGDKSFFMLGLLPVQNSSTAVYMNRLVENIPLASDRNGYNGESIIARYTNENNYYYAGLRSDGYVVIKKKVNGVFKTLAQKQVYAGTYDAVKNPNLIPHNVWIGLKLSVMNDASGIPQLTLSTDAGRTGVWKQVLTATDSATFGAPLASGVGGIQSDHADMQFDDFTQTTNAPLPVVSPTPVVTPLPTVEPAPVVSAPTTPTATAYDTAVLNATPVLYLTMSTPSAGSETDKSGHGLHGTYKGGAPTLATLPNGDKAATFNGTNQYLTVPSNALLSVPTTHKLTWEAWIRPDTLQFATKEPDGYIDWMGKCQNYSPTCEWEARMYNTVTTQDRPNRLSAYVFNPSAGLGSAADWQPSTGTIKAGQWLHVVAEYDTTATPVGCGSAYPGSINIWVNGVKQNFAAHMPTGCMSQYSVTPKANNSPLNIGTMTFDSWFKGAIGKVAVYDRLLSQSEISAHYKSMTGLNPTGSCGATCSF